MGHYANEFKSGNGSSGSDKHVTVAMMCYENNQDEKYEKGEEGTKNPEDEEKK